MKFSTLITAYYYCRIVEYIGWLEKISAHDDDVDNDILC